MRSSILAIVTLLAIGVSCYHLGKTTKLKEITDRIISKPQDCYTYDDLSYIIYNRHE